MQMTPLLHFPFQEYNITKEDKVQIPVNSFVNQYTLK